MDANKIVEGLMSHALWALITLVVGAAGVWLGRTFHGSGATLYPIHLLKDNRSMHGEISQKLQSRSGLSEAQRVLIIQYSGRWIMDTVNDIWRETNANVDIYLVDPPVAINPHQKKRCGDTLNNFENDLVTVQDRVGTMQVFTYPGKAASIRAVLFQGHMLYLGSYLFKQVAHTIGEPPDLDPRGGEIPLLAIPAKNPAFGPLSECLTEMVKNWQTNGVAKLVISKKK
jgi:hypothetical protein